MHRRMIGWALVCLLITVGFIIAAVMNVAPGDVKIICNVSVRADSISAGELKSVFLLQRRTLKDDSPVVPVLEKSGDAHEAFLRQYLDRGSEEMQTYYQRLVFTGKRSMPKELNSDTEVVPYVARTRGAIGYVSDVAATEGVKVLVVSDGRSAERTVPTRVEPEYPETLQRLQIGGTVRLAVTLSPRGTVEKVALLGGNPILAEAASKAVRQWVYTPRPSQTTIEVTVPFESHR
jgi:TonB family protein